MSGFKRAETFRWAIPGLLSLLVILAAASTHSAAQSQALFTTAVTNATWTVPAGVYSITVECWGGGGGGAGATSGGTLRGGGGGGGAYAMATRAVTPNQSVTYTVGAAGAGTTATTGGTGGTSSATYSSTTICSAAGGTGGTTSAKGTGGTAVTGSPTHVGGDGYFPTSGTVGGGGGGSAGTGADGTDATSRTGATAQTGGGPGGNGANGVAGGSAPASGPGGGGGGMYRTSGNDEAGGSGWAGQIRITYYVKHKGQVVNDR